MAAAGRAALSDSGVAPVVRGLYGYASVSEYVAPNELYAVHHALELPADVPVFPLDDPFTAFITSLSLARREAQVSAGSSLVICGARWSQNVDYEEGVGLSVGDGAGAAVIGSQPTGAQSLELLGHVVHTEGNYYGAMRLAPRLGSEPSRQTCREADGHPMFYMSDEMRQAFVQWGAKVPAQKALELLQQERVDPAEVSLICHQASRLLIDHWKQQIQPGDALDTLESFGNMTHATLPVTLSARLADLKTPYVLLLGLGLGFHCAACLLKLTNPNS